MEEKLFSISDYKDYDAFAASNRAKVNKYLNTVLWFCVLTGPAIAMGIKAGIFNAATYQTCISISLVMAAVSLGHFLMVRRFPDSIWAGFLAFIAIDMLLTRMTYSHIHVNITWFFVPLLSILYCEVKVYNSVVVMNYLFIFLATWLISPYNSKSIVEYNNPYTYFANAISGYTIESIVMIVGGYTLLKLSRTYFQNMIAEYTEAKNNLAQLNEQMEILKAMSNIYDNVNLLDFEEMTETSLTDEDFTSHTLDLKSHAHSVMNHMIKRKVIPEHFDRFQDFTNIRTLQDRLTGRKYIYDEFINIETGWFRAQYIPVLVDENGRPSHAVYTVQNINEFKVREQNLINISNTDELTHLYNRRRLQEDIEEYISKPYEDDLVIASIDINRLKYVNDNLGHAAGDELIKGAANCLLAAIGNNGKIYRTGGDEFAALLHTNNVCALDAKIQENVSKWKGEYVDSLALSIGYAICKDEHPDISIEELQRIADEEMYRAKNRYYQETGFDRRGQSGRMVK